jgi:hypothetical protein
MTSPYGGPLVPPLNAPQGAQPFLGIQPGVTGGLVLANVVVIFGQNGSILIYSGQPAKGNLIGSWAGMAGADQYGNAYPQGLNVTIGTISGTTISASTFEGSDFVVNSAGMFFYNETL